MNAPAALEWTPSQEKIVLADSLQMLRWRCGFCTIVPRRGRTVQLGLQPVRGVADLGGAMAAITIAAAGGCGHRLAGRHGLTQRAKTGGMSER